MAQAPIDFRPMQGLLHVGERLAAAFGLSSLWAGNDMLEGVIKTKLSQMGVPETPMPLEGPKAMTIRQMAEESGFIKRSRPQRRLKK